MQPGREELLEYLLTFLSRRRRERFQAVIARRTRHFAIVLEDIFQSHNASAVMRSCDCFGFQDIYLIENQYEFALNPDVALGADKWLSLIRYHGHENNTRQCIEDLKAKGYRIVATTPHENQTPLESLPLQQKAAILFGTELDGLSETALQMSDTYMSIPMAGFTESLNISVSAGIVMHYLHLVLARTEVSWQLTHDEKVDILLDWARKSVKMSEGIEQDFYKRYNR